MAKLDKNTKSLLWVGAYGVALWAFLLRRPKALQGKAMGGLNVLFLRGDEANELRYEAGGCLWNGEPVACDRISTMIPDVRDSVVNMGDVNYYPNRVVIRSVNASQETVARIADQFRENGFGVTVI